MAAGAYDDDIAATREMIEEDGQLCQWIQRVNTPLDPDKPWAGATSAEVSHDAYVVFVPANGNMFGLTRYRAAIEAGEFTTFGLMAPPEDWVPKLGEQLVRDGAPLVLVNLDALRPAEDVVLYILSIK